MTDYLIIDGRIEPDGEFTLRRTHTTSEPRHRAEPRPHDLAPLTATALDEEGAELSRATLRRYEPPDQQGVPIQRVKGVLALPAEAVSIRIVGEEGPVGQFLLHEPPQVAVAVADTNEDSVAVRIEYSDPTEEAWMAISVFADAQLGRTLYVGKPIGEYELDLTRSYGNRARVGVLYSTGTRSAAATSDDIELARRAAPLEITEPDDGSRFSQWDVIDARAGFPVGVAAAPELLEQIEWFVDKEPAGVGRLVALGPLDPGTHVVEARIGDSDFWTGASASSRVRIARG